MRLNHGTIKTNPTTANSNIRVRIYHPDSDLPIQEHGLPLSWLDGSSFAFRQSSSTPREDSEMSSAASLNTSEHVTDVPFVDRRQKPGTGERGERRQFGNSYHNLSSEGQQLAEAIDAYKVDHHRRYITTDELLSVLGRLGYKQTLPPEA